MTTYDVHLGDTLVGRLAADENGRSVFRFDPDYRQLQDRPVLGQYFEDVDLSKDYRSRKRGLPPFFANLLPEGGGLRKILEHTFNVPEDDDLALLSAVGTDLPGAVTLTRSNEGFDAELGSDDGEMELDGDDPVPSGLRFSLAGVQMKFSVLMEEARVTLPARDELGDWILKLDSPRFMGLVRNEFAVMSWAEHAGFDVPPRRLVRASTLPGALAIHAPEGSDAYLIRRFDRVAGRRIHQEDFAQVVNFLPERKYDQVRYEQCIALATGAVEPNAGVELLRRTVFMVASGNSDAHLKNLALLYPDGVHPTLAPLYDQVATVAWRNAPLRFLWALKLANTREPFQTSMGTFRTLAERARMDPDHVESVVTETLEAVTEAWGASEAPEAMPSAHLDMLRDYWRKSPLLADRAHALD